MRYANKVLSVDEAIAHVRSGSRLMLGEFVGAGEPACCIEALLASGIGQLTLITNTPGLRGGFLKARLFSSGQLAEFIGTHVGTTDESTQAYLTDSVHVAEFFPMGTWAEKVRAGALGLGGALVPVGVSILDQPGMFPKRGAPSRRSPSMARPASSSRPCAPTCRSSKAGAPIPSATWSFAARRCRTSATSPWRAITPSSR